MKEAPEGATPFPIEAIETAPQPLSAGTRAALDTIRASYEAEAELCELGFDLDAVAQSELHNVRDADDWCVVQSPFRSDLSLDVRSAGYARSVRYLAQTETMSIDRLNTAHRILLMSHAATVPSGAFRRNSGFIAPRGGHIEDARFVAPAAHLLDDDVTRFCAWWQGAASVDPVTALAVCDAWLVWTHPYSDGNGRIAVAAMSALAMRLFRLRGPLFFCELYMQTRAVRDPLLRALPSTYPAFARYYAVLVARAAARTSFRLGRRAVMIDRIRHGASREAVASVVDAVLLQPQGIVAALTLPPRGTSPFVDAGLFVVSGDVYRSDWAVRELHLEAAL